MSRIKDLPNNVVFASAGTNTPFEQLVNINVDGQLVTIDPNKFREAVRQGKERQDFIDNKVNLSTKRKEIEKKKEDLNITAIIAGRNTEPIIKYGTEQERERPYRISNIKLLSQNIPQEPLFYADKGGEKGDEIVECPDGQCQETNDAQKLLDEQDSLVQKAMGISWEVVNRNKGGKDWQADKVFNKLGVRSVKDITGREGYSCSTSATGGYKCVDKTIDDWKTLSNYRFKNAVEKQEVPFEKKGTYNDESYLDNLQKGDLVSFMGGKTNHMMLFSHWENNPEGKKVPIFLDSNGAASNFDKNYGSWITPSKDVSATLYAFSPKKKQIEAEEEKARLSPTYIDEPIANLPLRPIEQLKFSEGGEKSYTPQMEAFSKKIKDKLKNNL